MLDLTLAQRPAFRSLPGASPAAAGGENHKTAPASPDQGPSLCAIRISRSNARGPWRGRHHTHLPPTAIRVRSPPLAIRLRQGDRRAVLDQLEQPGATTKHLPAALRAPRCRLNSGGRKCERSGRSWANAPRAFSPESPWQRCSRNGPACCIWRPSWCSRPCGEGNPGVTEELIACCSKTRAGEVPPPGHRHAGSLHAATSPARIWPNGDVGVVVATATGEAVLFSQGWPATINKKPAAVHRPCWKGAGSRLRPTHATRPRAANMPLWALWCPVRGKGKCVPLQPDWGPGPAGGCPLVTPQDPRLAA